MHRSFGHSIFRKRNMLLSQDDNRLNTCLVLVPNFRLHVNFWGYRIRTSDVRLSQTAGSRFVILRQKALRLRSASNEGPMYSGESKTYFVYIMSNRSKTLYTGVTNKLAHRVWQHKQGEGSEFTTKYKVDRLVFVERFQDVHRAIGREKQIKGLLRIKKIALIVSVNPAWRDLSDGWYERHQFQPESA